MAERSTRIATTLLLMSIAAVLAAAVTAAMRTTAPLIPPATVTTTVVRATPDVLRAVRDLARLETVSFHMERVVDLREHQSRMWGLIEADDAILLVAVGEVIAGVDLSTLGETDIRVDDERHSVSLNLPAVEVFSARLDSERTYVHQRTTDTLARRQEQLETRARQQAERSIREGAIEAGVLTRAQTNAARTLRGLLEALGFTEVELRWRGAPVNVTR